MRIGIVGSRKFPELILVKKYIDALPDDSIIISGGANGVDTAAQESAENRGLITIIFLPDLNNCLNRLDVIQRYYDRNQNIVENSDKIIAFTEKNTGGTWDTIRRANKAGKRVEIIRPNILGGKC